ncbi:MAG: hypothetical protein ACSHX6_07330 [Akkermansiaceae bacterium]
MGNRFKRVCQVLVFIALWFSGALAFKAYVFILDAIDMTIERDFMGELEGDTRWLFDHYRYLFVGIMMVWITGLVSVWVGYRGRVVVLSFLVLWGGANHLVEVALKPIKKYEESKKRQDGDFLEGLDRLED